MSDPDKHAFDTIPIKANDEKGMEIKQLVFCSGRMEAKG
jgi:hypothetical protein